MQGTQCNIRVKMEDTCLLNLVLLLTFAALPTVISNPLITTTTTTSATTTPFHSTPTANSGDPNTGSSSSSYNSDPTRDTNPTSTLLPMTSTSSTPLGRCQYQYKETVRNEIFEVDGENLPLLAKRYFVDSKESRCYITRNDLESKISTSSTDEVIVVFALGCLNPQGTDVTFLEDEEAKGLEASSSSSGQEIESGGRGARNASSPYRYYDHVISYFQSGNCRINLKAVDIVANMSDLRVLSVHGHKAWNLSEVREHPELCRAFRNLAAFSVLGDWTTDTYLHHLALCKDYLLNVVEMDFTNDSLTSFPEVLYTAVPNMRALEITGNRLTSPVDFPWPSGFAELPRNLSRTYQFNVHYNFANSFDMEPNLFRRVFLMDNNQITNLTHFQFHSDFQFISIQKNGLREIGGGVFDNVPSLQFLSLAYNELESLPEDVFAGLVNLRRLDLQGNRLVRLPTNLFWNVRKLQRLNVEENRLEVLQEGVFRRLEELTEVKLKNNSITEVKQEAFTTLSVKLTRLELQNNPLKTFPVIVLLLRGLTNTNLENTDIEVLDFVEIGRQTTVSLLGEALKNPTTGTYMDMKNNPDFQKIISLRRSRLRSVVVYNDTRETVPIFMLVIKHFTIQVEDSKLACDCHILNVTHQLQEWTMDGTLTGEEACLGGWKCIWPSELSGKPVVTLKDSDTYCPLEEGGPGNTSCPEGCTCYLRTEVNTVIVDCQNGGLTSMPARVPANTRELWLQNNTIQSLEKHAYLAHLASLKLTSNNVQDLPIDVLLQMPELTVLHLDDNWLTGLKPDFAKLRQLRELRLAGNPFRCDCTTLWMKDWILGHQAITEDWPAIKCTTEDDDGQVFTAVPDDQFVCKVSASLGQLAVPVAIPVSLGFLLLTLAVVAFIQRRRLKVFLYIHTGYHPFDRDPPDHRALYDVTVVCDDVTARAWVLRHVIEKLEEGGRYKVFFYSRDAFVGFTVTENVRYCVKNSKRMVLVLGTGWSGNEVLVTAVHEALAKCHKDMPHFLTVLLHNFSAKDIDNKDLRQYVHRGRYICTEDKHFTKKLLYEMPHVKGIQKPEKGQKAGAKKPKKGLQGPEPVAMYDIVAVAKNEQNMKGQFDGENVGDGDGVFVRQVSERDIDVDLRLSGMNPMNIHRQNSHQPSIGDDRPNDDDSNADGQEEGYGENVAHPVGLQNQLSVESQKSQQPRSIFVWYANDDLPYTLKSIVEPLEKRGHACVLEDRDFPLGAAIQENIVHAVENSTRCIFVLSNRTAENDWFNFAFHVAFDRHLQFPDHRVALVSREEVDVTRFVDEVQQVIRTSSMLSEGDPWFWKRLKTFVHLDQVELC